MEGRWLLNVSAMVFRAFLLRVRVRNMKTPFVDTCLEARTY